MALILDTGPVYAALDRSDRTHRRCRALLEEATEPLVLPSPVLPEVDYVVSERLGTGALLSLLADIEAGAFLVEDLAKADYPRIAELMDRYNDQDLGFVDSALVAVAERMAEPKVVTLDHRHFAVVRPRHVDAFELLP